MYLFWFRVCLLCFLTSSPLVLAMSAFANETICPEDRLNKQLDLMLAHAGPIPTELVAFQALPDELQKSAFLRLSAAEQASLWRQQIDQFVSHHELGPKQAELLEMIRDSITSDLFRLAPSSEDSNLHELVLASRLLFEPHEVYEFAYTLSRNPPKDSNPGLQRLETIFAQEGSPLDKGETGPPDCSCNVQQSDACGSGWVCKSNDFSYVTCKNTSLGCGLFWLNPCNGECCFYLMGRWWC